jgi:hypothetical protein
MELQRSESDRRHAEVICPLERSREIPWQTLSVISRDPSTSLRFAQDDVEPLKPAEPRIRKSIARAIRGPARWVDVAVRLHRYRASLGFAAAISQKANEFLTCVELCARWLVSIEIAYETNAEGDIVQIIAVHMTAVYLTPPSIADFDLAVAG